MDLITRIELDPMPQLVEAVDPEDNWTGMVNAAERRRLQTRLNVRAYRRRRKALKGQKLPKASEPISTSTDVVIKKEVPCWVEDEQAISFFPIPVADALNSFKGSITPRPNVPQYKLHTDKVILPLSSDHLMTLLQFNVLRASLANFTLVSKIITMKNFACAETLKQVAPKQITAEGVPPSLIPTPLQQSTPHKDWIDIVPDPRWRDNLILLAGTYDEHQLWCDVIGGLFEGFPDSEVHVRGIIAWDPPWHPSGWELSEGFYKKWGWTLQGCGDVLQATNRWRKQRGEPPLDLTIAWNHQTHAE